MASGVARPRHCRRCGLSITFTGDRKYGRWRDSEGSGLCSMAVRDATVWHAPYDVPSDVTDPAEVDEWLDA